MRAPALLRQVRAGGVGVSVIAVGQGLPGYDLHDLHDLRTERLMTGGIGIVAVPENHRLAGRSGREAASSRRACGGPGAIPAPDRGDGIRGRAKGQGFQLPISST